MVSLLETMAATLGAVFVGFGVIALTTSAGLSPLLLIGLGILLIAFAPSLGARMGPKVQIVLILLALALAAIGAYLSFF